MSDGDNSASKGGQTHVFTSFPDSQPQPPSGAESGEDAFSDMDQQKMSPIGKEDGTGNATTSSAGLVDEDDLKAAEGPVYTPFQLEYYQKYFNVSTNDVCARIVASVLPTKLSRDQTLLEKIRPNPDLYGPFWITCTLIFTIAISGNLNNFFHQFGVTNSAHTVWHTDLHKVTLTATVLMVYWLLMPTILYMTMTARQIKGDLEFVELVCVYGYSLSIYIPIAVLWIFRIQVLQWALVLVATGLSGTVLVITFLPQLKQDQSKQFTYLGSFGILFMHALLGIGFMLHFF
jgi:hypothetical protein